MKRLIITLLISAATLALSARRGLMPTIESVARAVRERRLRRDLWRPIIGFLAVAQIVLIWRHP